MRVTRAPATIVVCCGVPKSGRPGSLATWMGIAGGARIPVTWVSRLDAIAPTVDVVRSVGTGDVALELDAMELACRPALRRELAAARTIAGGPTCAVAAGAPSLDHRELLVEHGIQAVAVGGFDHVTKSSRRPPPSGWRCRSIVWGMWEMETVPRSPRRPLGWMMPGFVGPRLAAGSLTVVHVDPGTLGERPAQLELERLVTWLSRKPAGVRAIPLSDLALLLQGGGQAEAGSVLRQAA